MMKKFILPIFFLISAAIISGCATSPSVSRTAEIETPETTYSIGAFQDANTASAKAAYPDATTIVRAAVETAFLKEGKNVVKDGGDVEIAGIVTAYYQGSFAGAYTTVGIDLTATDRKSSQILWKASLLKSTKYYYNYEPARWASTVANELVTAAFASHGKQ